MNKKGKKRIAKRIAASFVTLAVITTGIILLPKNAKAYVDFIESYCDTKVGIVSVGPDRNQTFNREKIWHK